MLWIFFKYQVELFNAYIAYAGLQTSNYQQCTCYILEYFIVVSADRSNAAW